MNRKFDKSFHIKSRTNKSKYFCRIPFLKLPVSLTVALCTSHSALACCTCSLHLDRNWQLLRSRGHDHATDSLMGAKETTWNWFEPGNICRKRWSSIHTHLQLLIWCVRFGVRGSCVCVISWHSIVNEWSLCDTAWFKKGLTLLIYIMQFVQHHLRVDSWDRKQSWLQYHYHGSLTLRISHLSYTRL